MKTSNKIALAKIVYQVLHGTRRAIGLTDRCIVTRNGCLYELDLAQGIDLAVYLNRYEPSTTRAFSHVAKPGMVVLDIGANVGIHTVNLARLVGPAGRVFAFEPTAFAFRKLKRNIEINMDLAPRVLTTQCFLGPTDTGAAPPTVYSSWPLRGGTELHAKHLGQPMSTDGVVSRSVDAFLAERGDPKVALVKLDVDGFECDVLAGATSMMRRDRPIFVMELAPYVLEEHGSSLAALLAHFTPLGYRFFDEARLSQPPINPVELQRSLQNTDGASKNVVAMP